MGMCTCVLGEMGDEGERKEMCGCKVTDWFASVFIAQKIDLAMY